MAGNRCNFSAGAFRRPTPHKHHAKFPKFIRDLQDVIIERGIPGLRCRAERDEACRAVLSASMYFLDVRVLRVGMPTEAGWQPVCWAAVQNLLPWLSRSRFFDAVDELKNVGVLDSTQRLLNPRKKTRSRTTTRGFVIGDKSVSEKLFSGLGKTWTRRLRHQQNRTAAALADRARAAGKNITDFYRQLIARRGIELPAELPPQNAMAPVVTTPSTVVAPSPRMIEMSTIAALIGRGIDGTAAIPMARELIASHGPGAPAVAAAG